MLKNYLTVTFRSLLKNRAFSFINIVGLAVGMAACLLILQYVTFELSYDNFHEKGDRLYRVNQDRYTNGKLTTQWAAGTSAIGPALKATLPEIEDYVKVMKADRSLISYKDRKLVLDDNYYAGSSFFKLFSYPLLKGDPATALRETNTVVLSEETARKLFRNEDAMGQLVMAGSEPLKVTGIMQDIPENTHLKIDFLQSYATMAKYHPSSTTYDLEKSWFSDGYLTYVLIKHGVDMSKLDSKLAEVAKQGRGNLPPSETAVYTLQPVKDIHLYSDRMMEARANGDGQAVYLLLGIAVFVVIIAWINYINLATARGIGRAKEVGVRKTLGSAKIQLVCQFMLESAVLNGLAMALAVVIISLCVPAFASLTGLDINFSLLSNPSFWVTVTILFLIGSGFSGFYPAVVLSGFRPVEVLKGKFTSSSKGVILRKGMVVFQFAASIFLLIGSLAVYLQVDYMQGQKLGVKIDQTLVIRPPLIRVDSMYRDMSAFKHESLSQNSIKNISISTSVPGSSIDWNVGRLRQVGEDEDKGIQSRVIATDYEFLKAYDIKLLAGRYFSPDYATDNGALILNRASAERFGFNKPEEAIGKQLVFNGTPSNIVGVVENFHQESLRTNYDAIIFKCDPKVQGQLSVKVDPSNISQIIGLLKTNWAKYFPGDTFDYFFLDQHFNEQYKADQRFGKVFGIFTLIAIFVACMGLFGLVSYTIVQRTKEIGIRKVLGASVREILQLLYKDFALLILISFVISAPLGWYAVHRWLEGYAFRIDVNLLMFIVPFLGVLTIAFSTISMLTVKAALMNPVKSLKIE